MRKRSMKRDKIGKMEEIVLIYNTSMQKDFKN